ncbi:MAG TPA: 23S rRNA (pseudouridine(1915)-N(3))-methyltransferase RlmH [Candidatus Saccharimonadales bacterium]|nr:23S rRNA (pseudouridine(1915)-N(3))-methyltransferase RlmH [Candidatus Saccharimonadales bacterium]
MKLHLVTVGKPRLAYATAGWQEYLGRLQRLQTVRVTQLADKYANDATKFQEVTAGTTVIVLEITGQQFTSEELASFLQARQLDAKELSLIIGGPEGLPQAIRAAAYYRWSLGKLTLPHDLAMVVTLEALYRASTINAHLPYHK